MNEQKQKLTIYSKGLNTLGEGKVDNYPFIQISFTVPLTIRFKNLDKQKNIIRICRNHPNILKGLSYNRPASTYLPLYMSISVKMSNNGNLSNYTLAKGLAAALISMVGAVGSTALVQALQGAVPDFELSAFRSIAPGPTYFILGKLSGADFRLTRLHVVPLIALSVLYVAYNVGYFGSSTYIPLAEVVGISNICTIISSMVFAKVVFKRDVRKIDVLSLFLCSFSFVLLIQPSWLFPTHSHNSLLTKMARTELPYDNSSTYASLVSNGDVGHYWNSSFYFKSNISEKSIFLQSQYSHGNSNVYTSASMVENENFETTPIMHTASNDSLNGKSKNANIGYALAIVGGIAQGMCYEVNAVLLSDIQPVVKTAYFTSLYFIISLIISVYTEPFITNFNTHQLLLIIGHSVGSGINDYFTIYTVHIIGAVMAGLFYSLEIVLFIFVQFTFMKSIMPGHQNWIEVVGVFVMVFGAAVSPVHDMLQNHREANILP